MPYLQPRDRSFPLLNTEKTKTKIGKMRPRSCLGIRPRRCVSEKGRKIGSLKSEEDFCLFPCLLVREYAKREGRRLRQLFYFPLPLLLLFLSREIKPIYFSSPSPSTSTQVPFRPSLVSHHRVRVCGASTFPRERRQRTCTTSIQASQS